MVHIVAESFVHRYDNLFTAIISIALAALAVALVNRAFTRRGRTIATAVAGGELSPVATTRLRLLRRIVDVVIIVIGVAIAMSQFDALDRLGRAVLASSAIAAAVVGFAARQTLANAVAGIMLAITQPLRIGDVVTFEGETGTVEDVRLTYTWLRTGADQRIVVPNERLASGILRNDSIVTPTVATEVAVWLGREQDAVAAADLLRDRLPDATVRVAETTSDATRLLIAGAPATPSGRGAAEAELREAALRALRDAGLTTGHAGVGAQTSNR